MSKAPKLSPGTFVCILQENAKPKLDRIIVQDGPFYITGSGDAIRLEDYKKTWDFVKAGA